MSESKTGRIDRKKLPWYYRLVLRVPGADFLESTSSGVFWAIVVPVFLFVEVCSELVILVGFPFPYNIALAAIVPFAVFLVFIRISLERFIRYWNSAIQESGREWNVSRTMPEYLKLLKKKKEEDK